MSKGLNPFYIAMGASVIVFALTVPVYTLPASAGVSGPGGPRFDYDNPPKIGSDRTPVQQRAIEEQSKWLEWGEVREQESKPNVRSKAGEPGDAPRRHGRPTDRADEPPRQTQTSPGARQPAASSSQQRAGKPTPSPGAKKKPGPHAPDVQRRQLLTKLYSLLSDAKSEGQGARIAQSIEQLWLHSGSPTTDLLMKRADQAIETGRWASAETFADTVVKLQPDFTEGLMRRAMINVQRGRVQSALRDLRRVLAIEPSHFVALERMGLLLDNIGEPKAALKAYRQLKRIHPHALGLAARIEQLTRQVDGEPI